VAVLVAANSTSDAHRWVHALKSRPSVWRWRERERETERQRDRETERQRERERETQRIDDAIAQNPQNIGGYALILTVQGTMTPAEVCECQDSPPWKATTFQCSLHCAWRRSMQQYRQQGEKMEVNAVPGTIP